MSQTEPNREPGPDPDPGKVGFSGDGTPGQRFSGAETTLACGSAAGDSELDSALVPATENSESTIRRVLNEYDIGRKIRQLRLKKKIALVDLGKHTGLSASMLSQLENGKLIPTLPTLARIAMVFDIGIDHFFVDRKEKYRFSIVRATERIRFPENADEPKPGYFFECLAFGAQDKNLHPYLAEFAARDEYEATKHSHPGTEFVFLLEGQLEISYREDTYLLNSGDSAYFDSSEPHSYRGLEERTKAIVVTTSA